MKRVIVYGDIHGCLDELRLLREKLAVTPQDLEISVGDILNKGPWLGHEMIRYVQEHRIAVVVGNNEEKAAKQYKKYKKEGVSFLKTLRPFEIATVMSLQESDYRFLKSLPYFMKVKNLTILHGGLKPGMQLEKLTQTEKKELTLIRYFDKSLNPIPWHDKENRYCFWAEVYDGTQGFIVSGHHPFEEPKICEHAVDIDTGCVYGGKLTAAVFPVNEKRVETENVTFVSEKAKRDYWGDYLYGEGNEKD